MRKSLIFALVTVSMWSISSMSLAEVSGSFGVSGASKNAAGYFEVKPGEKIEDYFYIENNKNQDTSFEIVISDPNKDDKDIDGSLAKWVSMSTGNKEIMIKMGARMDIPFIIAVPSDAEKGKIYKVLFRVKEIANKKTKTSADGKTGAVIDVVSEVITAVKVKVSDETKSFSQEERVAESAIRDPKDANSSSDGINGAMYIYLASLFIIILILGYIYGRKRK